MQITVKIFVLDGTVEAKKAFIRHVLERHFPFSSYKGLQITFEDTLFSNGAAIQLCFSGLKLIRGQRSRLIGEIGKRFNDGTPIEITFPKKVKK